MNAGQIGRIAAYAVAACLSILILDAIACKLISPILVNRELAWSRDRTTIDFRINGTNVCLFSTEGPFPEYHQNVRVTFKNPEKFIARKKDRYEYGTDFSAPSVRTGDISWGQNGKTLVVNLQFISGKEFISVVNGVYSYIKVE